MAHIGFCSAVYHIGQPVKVIMLTKVQVGQVSIFQLIKKTYLYAIQPAVVSFAAFLQRAKGNLLVNTIGVQAGL